MGQAEPFVAHGFEALKELEVSMRVNFPRASGEAITSAEKRMGCDRQA